jgi:F420H(2)-dependent quinone reductase
MSDETAPRIPPRWFVRTAWRVHRAIYRISGRRLGLWTPGDRRRGWGAMALTTTGRRSGQARTVIVAYLVDGENLVAVAMNGWAPGEPAWWLNLQAHAEAVAQLPDEAPRAVRAREAGGEERERLWARLREVEPEMDGYEKKRGSRTAVVVLTPRDGDGDGHAEHETPTRGAT